MCVWYGQIWITVVKRAETSVYFQPYFKFFFLYLERSMHASNVYSSNAWNHVHALWKTVRLELPFRHITSTKTTGWLVEKAITENLHTLMICHARMICLTISYIDYSAMLEFWPRALRSAKLTSNWLDTEWPYEPLKKLSIISKFWYY